MQCVVPIPPLSCHTVSLLVILNLQPQSVSSPRTSAGKAPIALGNLHNNYEVLLQNCCPVGPLENLQLPGNAHG